MTARLLLATESGIVIAQRTQADWEQVGHTLAGERATSIIARRALRWRRWPGGDSCHRSAM